MTIRADHVAGAVFVLFGILVIALSGDLPFGDLSMPGAGFMPRLVAGLIVLFGAALILHAKDGPLFSAIAWDDGRHALAVIATAAAAAAIYEWLGFILTMVAMMVALMVLLEKRNIVRAVLYSAGVAVATWIVFVHLLNSPLPGGVLGYW